MSASESIKDGLTIFNDAWAAATSVVKALNGSHSTLCTIVNSTPGSLRLKASHHAHGGFQEVAPQVVGPQSAGIFSTRDGAWSVGTGTEGWVRYSYRLPGYDADLVDLTFHWDLPAIGSNSSYVDRSGPHPRVVTTAQAGSGEEKVPMTFTLIDLGVDLYGTIREKWEQLGGQVGVLGWPSSSEGDLPRVPGGRVSAFDHGLVHFVDGEAHEIHGEIARKVATTPGLQSWGAATDVITQVDGVGQYSDFQDWSRPNPEHLVNASVVWYPGLGAHPVGGDIRRQWLERGGVGGPLGYPLADEAGGLRSSQDFQGGRLLGPVPSIHPVEPLEMGIGPV